MDVTTTWDVVMKLNSFIPQISFIDTLDGLFQRVEITRTLVYYLNYPVKY